jgi:hypothetical protein
LNIGQAGMLNINLVDKYTGAMKRTFDTGIVEQVGILGTNQGNAGTNGQSLLGLATQPNVSKFVNSVIVAPISSMTPAQLVTLGQQLLSSYIANSKDQLPPDTFLLPLEDWVGLGTLVSSTYPTAFSFGDALRMALGWGGLKIDVIPCAYLSAGNNKIGGSGTGRYILYRAQEDCVQRYIPIPFTMTGTATADNFNMTVNAYGQVSDVLCVRPASMCYYDLP